jgi:hypothetical protein
MSMQSWLPERWTANRLGRVHDGKVIVMRSNLRRCSDAFRDYLLEHGSRARGLSGRRFRSRNYRLGRDRQTGRQGEYPKLCVWYSVHAVGTGHLLNR